MVVGVAGASLLRQPVLDGACRAIPSSLGHARWQQHQPQPQQQQHERTRQQFYQQQQQERTIASSEPASFFSDSVASVRFPKSANTVIRSGSALLSYADCSSTSDATDVRRTVVRQNSRSPISSHAETSNPWGLATSGPTALLSSWPVRAAVAEAAGEGLKWWERGAAPNMLDIFSTQQFVDALQAAGDRLVIVDFFASWCPSCRALFPKLCKIAAEYDDIVFLKVNIDENRQMCKSLNVKVLPYFHIYRGASGRLDTFSCSLSKLQRLRDAISKHHDGPCEDCDPPEVIPEVLSALLVKREEDQAKAAAGSSD